MQTVMTHNNGYDAVLLVDDEDTVVSAWLADEKVIEAYVRDTDADLWEVGVDDFSDDFSLEDDDGNPCEISDYGTEVGRDGEMTEERRVFWGIED